MKLDIIDRVEQFTDLHDDWQDLLAHCIPDNPFQSNQWLLTWWQVFGSGELHVITCRDMVSGELLGALPLYRTTVGGILRVSVLRLLGSGPGSADFLGCIARQGRESEVFGAFLKELLQDKRGWDLIELQDMDSDSPFCRFLRTAAPSGMFEVCDPDKRCPYLALPESWDDLVKGVSKKVRQRIGYYRRALDKIGDVELELVVEAAQLPGALTDMIRLRQDRMEQKGITTAAITDAYCRFHGQLMTRLLECGRFQLYFLRLDGQRIAYLYQFSGGSGAYFYQTGFDRTWGSQSVGFVLLGMVIERSINEGYSTFEFLRGSESYKYEWGNVRVRELMNIVIPNNTIKAYIHLVNLNIKVIVNNLKTFVK